jgi:hypothetical protein
VSRGGARGLALAAAAVLLAPHAAWADEQQRLDALFSRGKRLLEKKQYAEACVTFERVDNLDPGIGAKVNVARCYEEWGRIATAYRWYAAAERMARGKRDPRARKIRELLDKLDPDVPRLTIAVPGDVDLDEAAITLDGERLSRAAVGREAQVDPGPHVITYRAGGERRSKTIAVERGASREVTLDFSAAERPSAPLADRDSPRSRAPAHPGRTRRIIAISMMGAGGVGVGLSTYLALDARSAYRGALDLHCNGLKDQCSDEGLRLTGDARDRANLATAVGLVGLAVAGGGLALYLTAPRGASEPAERRAQDADDAEALYVAPVIGDRIAGIVIGGRY